MSERVFFMPHITNRVILFANGDLKAPEKVRQLINQTDFLIAVDGGLKHIDNLGLLPNLIIGDLDSVDQVQLEKHLAQGVEIRTYPREKNETDLEIALGVAESYSPTEIILIAALGGRLDQTLANIFLLTRQDLAIFNIRLIDGATEVFLIRSSASIHGSPGETVSLLPLNGPAFDITTTGLKYPLLNETLYTEHTRGISNQLSTSRAEVTLTGGMLLCIHETN